MSSNNTSWMSRLASQAYESTSNALTSATSIFSSSTDVTATEVQPPAERIFYHQPPDAQAAYNRFIQDPGTFIRRNDLEIGGHHRTAQTNQFTFASRGQAFDPNSGQGITRRSSVDGEGYVPLNTYKLIPKSRYDLVTSRAQKQHDSTVDVKLGNVHMDTAPSGQHTDTSQMSNNYTDIISGQQQNLATNALSGCLLKLQDSRLSHIQPTSSPDDTFGSGVKLQQQVAQMDSNAQLFGAQDYADATARVSVFMQSSRRGSVHLYGRSAFHTEADDGSQKSAEYFQHYFPSTAPPLPQARPQFSKAIQDKVAFRDMRIKKQQQRQFSAQVDQDLTDNIRKKGHLANEGRHSRPSARSPVHPSEWD